MLSFVYPEVQLFRQKSAQFHNQLTIASFRYIFGAYKFPVLEPAGRRVLGLS